MAEDHAIGIVVQRRFHHQSRIGGHLCQASLPHDALPQHPQLGGQGDDVEPLLAQPDEQRTAVILHVAIVGQAHFLLAQATLVAAEHRHDEGDERSGLLAHALHRTKLIHRRLQHAPEAAKGIQQPVR